MLYYEPLASIFIGLQRLLMNLQDLEKNCERIKNDNPNFKFGTTNFGLMAIENACEHLKIRVAHQVKHEALLHSCHIMNR
jgi:hypothetical protein